MAPTREHLAISVDILVVNLYPQKDLIDANLVGRDQICCVTSYNAQKNSSQQKSYVSQNTNSAAFGKP